ncbi:NAD-binding protein [Planosporangium sp. 12N6]|uniref:NAD-binding protein n=1 Tax=Planosporangium spinosum TaxID=3402278 RepID=UPI003CE72018
MAAESWIRRLGAARSRRAVAVRGREVLRRQVNGIALRAGDNGNQRPHLVVCGDDPLAYRLVEELVTRYGAHVTVILPSRHRGHGPQIARLRVGIVESDRLDGEAFRRAGVDRADALAVVHQDDVGNIHAALQAQELNPRLRLVIRMFNMSLGYGIRQLFSDCRVLSDAAMATPTFVSAALGEMAPVYVRLTGRTLVVARRGDVRPEDVICGLATSGADGRPERLLPRDSDRTDLVLAVARGIRVPAVLPDSADYIGTSNLVVRGDGPAVGRRAAVAGRLRRRRRRPLRALSMLVSRKLRLVALALVGLLIAGTVVLKVALGRSWLNAGYLAILDALAGAQPDIAGKPVVKVTETVLTIVSIALIPVLTAAVVEAVVNARLALTLGRLREPISDHVVVVGLGNVGTRVIRQLHDLGVPVVAIDRSEDARGIPVARELGIPYIIGEAHRVETLRAASVHTCRALVVVSTDDGNNLETAIQGRALQEDMRVVLRLFDGDFADRVQRAFGITSSRSVSYVAAPAFAAAMLEREVIGTISVNRRVLLVAEVPVCAGSELAGAVLADADDVGEARTIAVVTDRRRTTLWELPPQRRLAPDDILIVVATRDGLGRLLARTGPPGETVAATDGRSG